MMKASDKGTAIWEGPFRVRMMDGSDPDPAYWEGVKAMVAEAAEEGITEEDEVTQRFGTSRSSGPG